VLTKAWTSQGPEKIFVAAALIRGFLVIALLVMALLVIAVAQAAKT
jgi:hypothetical protein